MIKNEAHKKGHANQRGLFSFNNFLKRRRINTRANR